MAVATVIGRNGTEYDAKRISENLYIVGKFVVTVEDGYVIDTIRKATYGDVQMAKVDWNNIWLHFNRMQKRVMEDKVTKKEFMAEPEDDRMEFYHWMEKQCGEYSCWM